MSPGLQPAHPHFRRMHAYARPMQNRQLFALGLIGVAVVAVCVGALIYGLVQDPQVAGPIAGAIGVVAVAVLQRRWEKRQELERLRRAQMAPIYEQLISIVKTTGGQETATADFFQDFSTKLVLYGPPPIIKSWNAFRTLEMPKDMTDPTYLLTYEQLLFLMRKDLGHDDTTLMPGDLLRVYVNDFDEMYALWMAKQAAAAETDP